MGVEVVVLVVARAGRHWWLSSDEDQLFSKSQSQIFLKQTDIFHQGAV